MVGFAIGIGVGIGFDIDSDYDPDSDGAWLQKLFSEQEAIEDVFAEFEPYLGRRFRSR